MCGTVAHLGQIEGHILDLELSRGSRRSHGGAQSCCEQVGRVRSGARNGWHRINQRRIVIAGTRAIYRVASTPASLKRPKDDIFEFESKLNYGEKGGQSKMAAGDFGQSRRA